MDFSVDQAKTIFDLIKAVSPYAYPLLISLVFPIFWILMKKLMGFSNTTNTVSQPQGNLLRRLFSEVSNVLSLRGDISDKIVFYVSIALFFVGGFVLKVGEHNEEVIRQKTLGLKHLYEENGYLFYDTGALRPLGYTKDALDDITYTYPEEFLRSGSRILCVDSNVKKSVFAIYHVLLDSYIRERLKHDKVIYLDSLYQDFIYDSTQQKYLDARSIKKYFSPDIVFTYLASPANKEKYNLDVVNDMNILIINK